MMPEFTEFHPMFFCLLDAVQALLPERFVYSPRQGGGESSPFCRGV